MKFSDVIKYEGDNSTFIWKHECEDFNSSTQLIVHESQEAVFFMNGQALDTFGPGRHTLETQNIPKIGKILNRTTGGDNPFHCEVYFINLTVQMNLKWGTDSQISFIEPTYGVPLLVGAHGSLNLQVADSRKLLVKLVGTMNGIAWQSEGKNFTKSLEDSFRPLVQTAVKSNLAKAIVEKGVNVLEIDQQLEYLSEVLKAKILPGFEEYGLTIPQFYVNHVAIPETRELKNIRNLHTMSFNKKYAEAHADYEAAAWAARRNVELEKQTTETEIAKRAAERDLIKAQAQAEAAKLKGFSEAAVMQAQGYNQKDIIQAEVQKAYAEGLGNMGSSGSGGGMMGDIMGLGVGMAAAGAVAPKVGEMFKGFSDTSAHVEASIKTEETVKCPGCGADVNKNSKFCAECGSRIEILGENEMICPFCNKKTFKGKFCSECGKSFIKKCSNCGAELQNNEKFCHECGTKAEE